LSFPCSHSQCNIWSVRCIIFVHSDLNSLV
jgi:hypothetical protein